MVKYLKNCFIWAVSKGLIVRFCPFEASEGRLKGNRLGIAQDLTMDKINYNLAS